MLGVRQHLERHLAALSEGAVHVREPAVPERPHELVRAEHLARGGDARRGRRRRRGGRRRPGNPGPTGPDGTAPVRGTPAWAEPVRPAGVCGPDGATTRVGDVCGGITRAVPGGGTTAVRSTPRAGGPAGPTAGVRVVSSDKQGSSAVHRNRWRT
nr:hypothetical protein GCM10025730_07660 [Promicromonospora thailandica]